MGQCWSSQALEEKKKRKEWSPLSNWETSLEALSLIGGEHFPTMLRTKPLVHESLLTISHLNYNIYIQCSVSHLSYARARLLLCLAVDLLGCQSFYFHRTL